MHIRHTFEQLSLTGGSWANIDNHVLPTDILSATFLVKGIICRLEDGVPSMEYSVLRKSTLGMGS